MREICWNFPFLYITYLLSKVTFSNMTPDDFDLSNVNEAVKELMYVNNSITLKNECYIVSYCHVLHTY